MRSVRFRHTRTLSINNLSDQRIAVMPAFERSPHCNCDLAEG
jgi:hypothetical protein